MRYHKVIKGVNRPMGRCGRVRIVVEFKTIYEISDDD
jgi:hypothetical protein